MKLKKKHQGLNPHRLASNPLEQRFAEAWQAMNEAAAGPMDRVDTIDYILHQGDQHFPIRCSERERAVANSVIQWLGSPVGESFIRQVLSAHDMAAEVDRLAP